MPFTEKRRLQWNETCYNKQENSAIKWKDSYGGDYPSYDIANILVVFLQMRYNEVFDITNPPDYKCHIYIIYVDIFIYVKAKACFHTGGAKNLFSQSLGPIVGPVDYSVCSILFLIITNCNACTWFGLYFRAYPWCKIFSWVVNAKVIFKTELVIKIK